MKNKTFLNGVERVLATFAQAFLAMILANASGITQTEALKVAAVAGLLSAGKTVLLELNTYLKD